MLTFIKKVYNLILEKYEDYIDAKDLEYAVKTSDGVFLSIEEVERMIK